MLMILGWLTAPCPDLYVCLHVVFVSRYADGPKYYSDPKLLSFELNPYSSPEATAGEEPLPLGLPQPAGTFRGLLLLINHSLGARDPTTIGAVCSLGTQGGQLHIEP